jgi:MYXO-CTERM domain-containing protein
MAWRFRTLALLVSAVSLALLVAGCSGGDGEYGQTESALFTNDQAAFNFFVGKGLTSFQSAGIVGNLDMESGVNPNAVQQGGPGRGIAQWSVGGRWDTSNNDNATAYASKQGESVWSLQLQLEFIWYELTTFSAYGLSALKATTNVTDATVAFETDFERCGSCAQSSRVKYAQAVLNAYGSVAYAASYVSQSFPLATTTLVMQAGQVIPSYIELKNTGTKAWDSNTRLGTTQPRDRASAFADATWIAPNRPAGVNGTVAPGGTYKFEFDLAAPDQPGVYDEFFGVVEEGVAWFSDSGQGGPADDQIEVKIQVVASDGGVVDPDAGAPQGDAGTDPGHESDGGSKADGGSWHDAMAQAGCSVGPAPDAASHRGGLFGLALIAGAIARARRRRRDQ